ncbi:Uncharacterised protein [Segatella copri]|nr:Uncharacterised protein [Segatella copri]
MSEQCSCYIMLTSYELNIHWASYCSTGHDKWNLIAAAVKVVKMFFVCANMIGNE